MDVITSLILYALLGLSGINKSRDSSIRFGSSVGGINGGSSILFEGRYDKSFLIWIMASSSDSQANWATPDFSL